MDYMAVYALPFDKDLKSDIKNARGFDFM